MCVSIFFDGLHGVCVAGWEGSREEGIMSTILCAASVTNLERGPWDDEAF